MIEINADLGEGAGHDQEILPLIQRANICLGTHAGSFELTTETVHQCQAVGVAFCGHPGYPDREHFGRRSWAAIGVGVPEARSALQKQVEPWVGQMSSIKPHGGFYNDSQDLGEPFDLLVDLLGFARVALLGMPGTAHEAAAQMAGVPFIAEGFADRAYTAGGRLVPRSDPGAFVSLARMPEHLESLIGRVRSICVHGDGSDPVARLEAVHRWIEQKGVEVRAWTS